MKNAAALVALSYLLQWTAVYGQTVAPYPTHACGSVFGDSQCPGQSGCCAGGAACCAGGCCPLTAECINQGSANEACCPAGDASMCGYYTPTTAAPAGCATDDSGGSGYRPSKNCVGVTSDWYCAYNEVCGSNGGCFRKRGDDACATDSSAPIITSADAGATTGVGSAASPTGSASATKKASSGEPAAAGSVGRVVFAASVLCGGVLAVAVLL